MTDPHLKDMIKQRQMQLHAYLYEADILRVDIERLQRRLGEEPATTSSYKHTVLLSSKGINNG